MKGLSEEVCQTKIVISVISAYVAEEERSSNHVYCKSGSDVFKC